MLQFIPMLCSVLSTIWGIFDVLDVSVVDSTPVCMSFLISVTSILQSFYTVCTVELGTSCLKLFKLEYYARVLCVRYEKHIDETFL
jgi:hypothetical protein